MKKKNLIVSIPNSQIENIIFLIRGQKVILSSELAKLYGVAPRVLIQAVKRNVTRFPKDFMFQLNDEELKNLKSQIVISSWGGARRANPYAFTEQGVAMLSSVLNSLRAIQVNIGIMRLFVKIRRTAYLNKETIEAKSHQLRKLLTYKTEHQPQYENTRMISILERLTKEIKPQNKDSIITKLGQLSEAIKAQNRSINQVINKEVLPTGIKLIPPEILLTKLSDDIVTLIYEINEITSSKNGKGIFNVTPKTFKSSHDLHKLVKTRKDLNELIDALYFIIFEGSKQTKNIPKNKISELLDPVNPKRFRDDFIAIKIRNLRWECRHDPGFENKSEGIIYKISDICRKYVNKDSIPEFTPQDFLKFQEEILKEVKQFLLKLKYAISL